MSRRRVDKQLGEIDLRADVVAATRAGDAGKDRGRAAAARIAHQEAVVAIMEILPYAIMLVE
jgi:hypothetical protein